MLGVKEREDGSLLIEGLKDARKLLKDFWNMVNNRQKVSSNILTYSMVKIEKCENKDAEGFKFANPGTIRVSLKDAIQDNTSDPCNDTMLKMLAMVEYGERAGSRLHRIFHT